MKGDFGATGTQLSEGECQQRMKEFLLWELAPDWRSISRTFVAKNFAEGLKFFNQIGELADVEGGHHPDLHLTDSRTVSLVLSTPAVKGLTIQDFNLARQIDKNTVLYSSKWLKGNPRTIEILLQNQDKDVSDIKKPDRRTMSGIGELLLQGQGAQGGVPPPQAEQGDVPLLQLGKEGVDALEYGWPKLLSDDDLEERLRFLSNWKLSPDRRSIYRTFKARNFSEGINFFNAVAELAEEEGHPPDLHSTEFRKVTVVLMTEQLQGLSSMDIIMAERINNIEVQYSETAKDIDNFLQSTLSQEPERSPQDSEVHRPEDSPQRPVLEVQPQNTSSQQQSSQAAKPQSRKSSRISFTESSADGQEADRDTATLLHSLILVYADAGAGGLSIQEAVRRMRKQGLPGLKERAKTVQVAKITNNHPDFVACDGIGCFALRKSLLKSFQSGALDAEQYADEKKMEATVLEKYASDSSKLISAVPFPEKYVPPGLPPARVPTPTNQKPSIIHSSGIQRRNSVVTPTSGHRQPV